jgi:hypothetical protein
MTVQRLGALVLLAAGAVTLYAVVPAAGQREPPPVRARPRLEPVAETKLLMEGLALPNFRGLEKILKQKPDSAEAWTFARGQALLIAETANLLGLRPPRSDRAQAAWFARTADLRDGARAVARSAAAQDYERARAQLVKLANTCNRCHRTFRKAIEIVPFEEAPAGK